MKKLLLSIFLSLPFLVQTLYGQLEVVGSDEYGRIYDITYDPQVENKLYAITLGNHLLQSTDNGVTWEILYSYPERSTALKSLRLLPDNHVSFYTTYNNDDKVIVLDLETLEIIREYSLPTPAGAEKTWISAYSLWEPNPDTALVLQGYSIGLANFAKVYYTGDGGKSWDEVYFNVDYNEVFPNNVAISAANPEKLFIMRGEGPTDVDGGLFVSEDAGATWTEQLQGVALYAMTFHPEDPGNILLGTFIGDEGENETLYRSLDGGITWNVIPINWTDMTLDNINAIVYNPTDLDNIIVLEENEIVITHDDFATVENFVYPGTDTHSYYYGLAASFNPFNGSEVFVNSDFYPLFSTDGGETLAQVMNPYFVTTGNIDISITDQEHLYYGVQFGYVHRDLSTGIDTPYDVKPIDYMSTDPGMTVYADFLIPGRVYTYQGSFMGKELRVSNDHGATTFTVYSGFSSTFHTAVSDPANPNVIWASFSSWGENPEVYKIDFTDQLNVQSTMITLPETDIVTGILIDPANSMNIMMAVGAKIFRSADGGDTWTESSGLEELVQYEDLILKLTYNPLAADQYSIATNKGIFTSLDNGATWNKIIDGLFHNVVHSTDIDGHIVAITHVSQISDFRLFYSNDGGTAWAQVSPENLAYLESTTTAVVFNEELAEVYIGTDDIGLAKYTVDINTVGTVNKPVFNVVSLYPNPVSHDLSLSGVNNTVPVEIYDIAGRVIMTVENPNVINVSQLESGVYILKARNFQGKIEVVRFIKK